MFVVELDWSDLRKRGTPFLSGLSIGAKNALKAQAEETRGRIVGGRYWTNRSGKTERSFKVSEEIEGLGVSVGSGRRVAMFLNNGTRAHTITGAPLRFVAGGNPVFAKRVRHPGTRAKYFIEHESEFAEPRTQAAVEAAAERAIAQAGLG